MTESAMEKSVLFEVKGLKEIRCVSVNACQWLLSESDLYLSFGLFFVDHINVKTLLW